MIEVTSIGRHTDSQALGEVSHRLVDVLVAALPGWSAKRLSTDQSSWRRSSWHFSSVAPRRDSRVGSNLESFGGHWFFSMNPGQFTCSHIKTSVTEMGKLITFVMLLI